MAILELKKKQKKRGQLCLKLAACPNNFNSEVTSDDLTSEQLT